MVAEGRSLARRRLRPRRPLIGRLLKVFQSRNVSISARLSTPAANQLPPCPPSSSSPPSGFFPFLLVSPSSSATWSFQDAIRMLSGCYQDALFMAVNLWATSSSSSSSSSPCSFSGILSRCFRDAFQDAFSDSFGVVDFRGWWINEAGAISCFSEDS